MSYRTPSRPSLVLPVVSAAVLLAASAVPAAGQTDWNAPFPPHRVMDNLYFVGTAALGSFLVTTPEGHILINADFESTVPLIRENMARLGFDFDDIRILLGSHAHGDHQQADGLVKELTGARLMVMAEDVPLHRRMRSGVDIDRVLRDGDEVTLGGETLVAHRTPGHTPGCTSWGLQLEEDGRTYHALIVCSFGVNANYVLVDNPEYPAIASDYRLTFDRARELPVDVFLASHGSFYGLPAKYEALRERGPGDPNPFVDPAGYRAHIDLQERRFEARLEQQQAR